MVRRFHIWPQNVGNAKEPVKDHATRHARVVVKLVVVHHAKQHAKDLVPQVAKVVAKQHVREGVIMDAK